MASLLLAGLFMGSVLAILPPAGSPSSEPVAHFEWQMEERAHDLNGDGFIDDDVYEAVRSGDSCYLNPEPCGERWFVFFDASSSTGEPPLTYELTEGGGEADCQSSPDVFPWLIRCSFPRLDTYDVTLRVTDGAGRVSPPFTEQVTVKDLLVVSIGDSAAAGEGEPDEPLPNLKWQDQRCHRSAKAGSARAARDLEENDPTSSVTFIHLGCSGATILKGLIGPYDGAEPIFIGQCSNLNLYQATTPDGREVRRCTTLDPTPHYCQKVLTFALCKELIAPQVDQLVRLLCPALLPVDGFGVPLESCPGRQRGIDVLMISIGVNDVGFGDVAEACSGLRHCHELEPSSKFYASHRVNDMIRAVKRVPSLLGQLPAWFDSLGGAIANKLRTPPESVFATEYPDPTHAADGSFCHMLPETKDFISFFDVAWWADLFNAQGVELDGFTPDESEWAYFHLLRPLNRNVYEAAVRNGWFYVGGIMQAFGPHGQCTGGDKWIHGLWSSEEKQGHRDDESAPRGTLHPNDAGYAEIGGWLYKVIMERPPRRFDAVNAITVTSPKIESVEGNDGWLIGRCVEAVPEPIECDTESVAVTISRHDHADLAIDFNARYAKIGRFERTSPNDTSFAAGDITGDGVSEIVLADGDLLRTFDPTGSELASIPFEDLERRGRIAVGNVVPDDPVQYPFGANEIVIVDGETVKIFNRTGVLLNRFSLGTPGVAVATGDVIEEAPSPIEEIVVADGQITKVFDSEGTTLFAFGQPFTESDRLATGNVVGTGQDEIVVWDGETVSIVSPDIVSSFPAAGDTSAIGFGVGDVEFTNVAEEVIFVAERDMTAYDGEGTHVNTWHFFVNEPLVDPNLGGRNDVVVGDVDGNFSTNVLLVNDRADAIKVLWATSDVDEIRLEEWFVEGDGFAFGDVDGAWGKEIVTWNGQWIRTFVEEPGGFRPFVSLFHSFLEDAPLANRIAVGNIVGDGRSEIVFAHEAVVRIFDEGGEIGSFPLRTPGLAVAVGNLSEDVEGLEEIAVVDGTSISFRDHFGFTHGQFAREFDEGDRIAVGNVDGSGLDEIVHLHIASSPDDPVPQGLTVFNTTGAVIAEYAWSGDYLAIGDVTGDATEEILVLHSGRVRIVDQGGHTLEFVSTTGDQVAVADIDGGLNEILVDGVKTKLVLTFDPATGSYTFTQERVGWFVETFGKQSSVVIDGFPAEYASLDPSSPHAIGGELDCSVAEDLLCNFLSGARTVRWLFVVKADGPHRFDVTATNVLGARAKFSYDIKVDLHPPETLILTAVDANGAVLEDGGSTLFPPVTVTFEGSDGFSGLDRFECDVNGGGFDACSSPWEVASTAPGTYLLRVRAVDLAGGKDPTPAEFRWTVLTPAEAAANLIDAILAMGLPHGVESSLTGVVGQVPKLLGDDNSDNDVAACNRLTVFLRDVDRDEAKGVLTQDQAAELRTLALNLMKKLGCP